MPDDLEDPQRAFHLEEWKSLREEIAAALRETRELERYVIFAMVAIWVWTIQADKPGYRYALLLPPFVAGLGAWRVHALSKFIEHVGGYLKTLEEALGHSKLGWEHHFRGAGKRTIQHEVGRSVKAFWITTLVASAVLSIAIACFMNSPRNSRAAKVTYSVEQ